jgi:hypothetical protein
VYAKYRDRVNGEMKLAGAQDTLAELTPLTDAFTALVRRPDFKHGIITNWVEDFREVPDRLIAFQNGAVVLRIKSQVEAKAGKMESALRDAETILLASRSDGYEPLCNQLIEVAFCNIGVTALSGVQRQCEDPVLLRRMLDMQHALAGQLVYFNQIDLPVGALDVVGMLREYRRLGVRVDYQNLTGREACLRYRIIPQKLNALGQIKQLPQVKNGVPQQNVARAGQVPLGVDEMKKVKVNPADVIVEKESLLDRYKNSLSDPFLFEISESNFKESSMRADLALNKFDLLRLETARKLYRLEKGKAPASDAELVPAYLPKLPVDRFSTDKKASFKDVTGVPYSIGPDAKDNGNVIAYDPTNGTFSTGDVALSTR